MYRAQRLVRPAWTCVRTQSTDARAVKLTNRSVLRLFGDENRDFLQGLITNDVHHLGDQGSCIYSLFLNKAGRVMYDAIIYGGEAKNELFIETDESVAKDLRKHLMIYRIRRKISIDLVDDEYNVWAVYGGDGKEIPGSTFDPRVKELGRRILTRNDTVVKELPLGSMKEYNQQRYKLGVAEGVKEITPGKAFPLEVNCDYMHGLSVHKGCYLGQEFTARTYHTGVVRKRIMPIEFEGMAKEDDDLVLNKEVVTAEDKAGGKVKAVEGGVGIGLLRIELVLGTKELRVNKTIPVKTWKPSWWPIVASKGGVE